MLAWSFLLFFISFSIVYMIVKTGWESWSKGMLILFCMITIFLFMGSLINLYRYKNPQKNPLIKINDIKYSEPFYKEVNNYEKYCKQSTYFQEGRPEGSIEYSCIDKKKKLDEIGKKYAKRLNEINTSKKYVYNTKTYSIKKAKG